MRGHQKPKIRKKVEKLDLIMINKLITSVSHLLITETFIDNSSLNADENSVITNSDPHQDLYLSGVRSPYVHVPYIDVKFKQIIDKFM